jgi:hypothetical protein
MNPSFFKAIGAFPTLGIMLAVGAVSVSLPAGAAAENAEDLIAKGDVYYARLQASESLKYYLPS